MTFFLLKNLYKKVHIMTQKTKKEQTTPLVTDSQKIFMKLIDDFPSHPYYVFDDEDMADLVESI